MEMVLACSFVLPQVDLFQQDDRSRYSPETVLPHPRNEEIWGVEARHTPIAEAVDVLFRLFLPKIEACVQWNPSKRLADLRHNEPNGAETQRLVDLIGRTVAALLGDECAVLEPNSGHRYLCDHPL
jgi:hypothetical protein